MDMDLSTQHHDAAAEAWDNAENAFNLAAANTAREAAEEELENIKERLSMCEQMLKEISPTILNLTGSSPYDTYADRYELELTDAEKKAAMAQQWQEYLNQ